MCAASESLKADRDLMGQMVWNYIVVEGFSEDHGTTDNILPRSDI